MFYRQGQYNLSERVILSLKKKKFKELFNFLASSLAPQIEKLLSHEQISSSDCLFTFVPRKRISVRRQGFDQSKLLAKSLAKRFGVRELPLLLRTGGKEQKALDRNERRENVERSLSLNLARRGFRLKYRSLPLEVLLNVKAIIVVDDIMTSGESLRRAVELLEQLSKSSQSKPKIFAACVAKSSISFGESKKP